MSTCPVCGTQDSFINTKFGISRAYVCGNQDVTFYPKDIKTTTKCWVGYASKNEAIEKIEELAIEQAKKISGLLNGELKEFSISGRLTTHPDCIGTIILKDGRQYRYFDPSSRVGVGGGYTSGGYWRVDGGMRIPADGEIAAGLTPVISNN